MSKECINTIDDRHEFRIDIEGIRANILLAAQKIINPAGIVNPASLVRAIGLRSDEENKRFYKEMVAVLSRSKEDDGCGYCRDCAEKAIEQFVTSRN